MQASCIVIYGSHALPDGGFFSCPPNDLSLSYRSKLREMGRNDNGQTVDIRDEDDKRKDFLYPLSTFPFYLLERKSYRGKYESTYSDLTRVPLCGEKRANFLSSCRSFLFFMRKS